MFALSLLCSCAEKRDELENSLSRATTINEIVIIIEGQAPDCLIKHGPITTKTSRKIFDILVNNKNEQDCVISIGRFAAYTGDVELLREIVFSYFGDAEGEAKTGYLERFIINHSHLFFSLPDSVEMWNYAGGAASGLDYPEEIENIVSKFAYSSDKAKKILADIISNKMDTKANSQLHRTGAASSV
jgi:hypothetical protein